MISSLLIQCIIFSVSALQHAFLFQRHLSLFFFHKVFRSYLVHSLRVEFVERAVHSYSDAELLKATVQSYLVHHGCQTGSTELCRTFGHHTANLLHQNTVITRAAGQTQVLKDGAHLPQRQTIAARNRPLIMLITIKNH